VPIRATQAKDNMPVSPARHPAVALIACHDCDLLQRERVLPPGGVARCGRCGAELYRNRPDTLERALAYTLAALVLFGLANGFSIVGLEVGGDLVQTTLFGAVRSLYEQQMRMVSAVVFLTTILTPLTELAALIYLLLPLKFNRAPPGAALVYRTLNLAHEWSMVEVFMLGVLVALVKLSHIAAVVPGIALWSFGGLMLFLAAATSAFDPRMLWEKLDSLR
jgi:paraquat-inducible protein A